ncbi:unnamed protein product [Lota lota]
MLLLAFRLLCLSVLSPLHHADTETPVRPVRHYASLEDRSGGSRGWRGYHGRLFGEVSAAMVTRRDERRGRVKPSVIVDKRYAGTRYTDTPYTDRYNIIYKILELRSCRDTRAELCRRRRRVKRDTKSGSSASALDGISSQREPPLPQPMGQVQTAPSGPVTETSDYEAFTPPDLGDLTPLVPGNRRPKWKRVKNPFYPLSAEACGAYAVMIAAGVLFSMGILGNVAVMCIVCHNYHMRSISNSLLANLAFWDFLVLFFCLPLVVFHQLTKDWLLGELSCRLIPYLEVASLGVTTFTLCALCIDRLRSAASVQTSYQPVENAASTSAKLAVIWVGALLLALPELLLRQLLTEEAGAGAEAGAAVSERCVVRISTQLPDTLYVLGLTYDGARLWWCFGCYFCLPTLFTICCSLATARRIRRAEASVARGDHPHRNKKQLRAESQMNCTVVALAILYGFCSVPENICNVLSVYLAPGVPAAAMDALHLVSQMLLFCKSAATPLLVFALCRPFRRAFRACCCCCWDQCSDAGADPAPGDGPSPGDDPSPSPGDDHTHGRDGSAAQLELLPLRTPHRQPAAAARYTAADMHC